MTSEQLKYSIFKSAFSGKLVESEKNGLLPEVKQVTFDDIPFDIPDTWIWSTLGNCCEMYTGNSISENIKKTKYTGIIEGVDYIATKDVTFENTIVYDNGVRIPEGENFKIAQSGSILMCIEGGSAGRKIGIIDKDVCFGNKLCMFNSKKINNRYIYYYLQSNEFKKEFLSNMSGIIGGVSIKKLKELHIPIPSIEEQKRIVKKIEELLPIINKYTIAYNKLENFNIRFPDDMKKSILQYAIQGKLVEHKLEDGTAEELYQLIQEENELLIKEKIIKKVKNLNNLEIDDTFNDIPDTWKNVRLGSIVYKITDGTHKTPKYTKEGIKFVSAKDITSGKLSFDSCKYISQEEHYILYERCNPEYGDILISKSGSIGSVVINEVNFEFSLFESLALVKYNQKLILPQYLKYAITNACYHLTDKEVKGVAVKHLPIAEITNMVIPLPPLEEQKRIVKKLEELYPYCDKFCVR